MPYFPVISGYRFFHHLPCSVQVRQYPYKPELIFKDAVYALGNRILIRVILLRCTQYHSFANGKVRVVGAAVLYAPVAVVYNCFPAMNTVAQSHQKGFLYHPYTHVVIEFVAHYFFGIKGCHQCKVSMPAFQFYYVISVTNTCSLFVGSMSFIRLGDLWKKFLESVVMWYYLVFFTSRPLFRAKEKSLSRPTLILLSFKPALMSRCSFSMPIFGCSFLNIAISSFIFIASISYLLFDFMRW